ncbi:uncharacterized protein [Salvelinus sp. IW2-2015]|uniref:uncharacterized protein n=1 Tax=Salvelinus sp. IW2-2015 TaxID=2691554 RepID=UPI0038D4D5BC
MNPGSLFWFRRLLSSVRDFVTGCNIHEYWLHSKEMHIQLSSATYEHLKGSHFIFERRGTITIKVRGHQCHNGNRTDPCNYSDQLVFMSAAVVEIETYWLNRKRDKDGGAQAACPQFETQTISKAISKATISAPETSGDHDRLVFPSVAREDEDDVKSIRSHRIKMDISGHHSLVESLEECRAEEMSVSKVRRSHYKDALHHNNGLQDSHIELDSPEFDVHNSIMASPDGSIDSHCSEKSAMCSVS